MTIRIYAASFDAVDAAAVATFWGAALGRNVNPEATLESASLAIREGTGDLVDPEGNEFDLIRG